MNNMKLCFTPTAHFFDNSKLSYKRAKVGLMKAQRLAAVSLLPCRRQNNASEQGSHSSFFPSPLKKRNFPNYFKHALQGNDQGAHQHAAIITDKCLQSVSEPSVGRNTTNYGGQCLRGYTLEPCCLVTTQSASKKEQVSSLFSRLCVAQSTTHLKQIKTRAPKTPCGYLW